MCHQHVLSWPMGISPETHGKLSGKLTWYARPKKNMTYKSPQLRKLLYVFLGCIPALWHLDLWKDPLELIITLMSILASKWIDRIVNQGFVWGTYCNIRWKWLFWSPSFLLVSHAIPRRGYSQEGDFYREAGKPFGNESKDESNQTSQKWLDDFSH